MQTTNKRKIHGSERLHSLLSETNFIGSGRDGEILTPDDPSMPMQMLVEIDNIRPYERNPRRIPNPRYAEIRDSIRAQGGLNTPLTITRRPGEPTYIVEAGGNTRLKALNELWRETGDQRYFRIHCMFRPWRSESHVLSAHLIENELRSDMSFVDKALAVIALKQQYESERGSAVSQRHFIDILKESGIMLSRPQLYRITYVVDILFPLIPLALTAGLGVRDIDELRQSLDTYRQVFIEEVADQHDSPGALFDALLADVLVSTDSEVWDFDAAPRDMLEQKICETLGTDLKMLRANIAVVALQRAAGSTQTEPDPGAGAAEGSARVTVSSVAEKNSSGNNDKNANPLTEVAHRAPDKNRCVSHDVSGEFITPRVDPIDPKTSTVTNLRAEIYTIIVASLKDVFGDEADTSVIHTPEYGAGYLLNSIHLIDQGERHNAHHLIWWWLASLSGVFASEESFGEAVNLGCIISPEWVGQPDPLPRIAMDLCEILSDQQVQRIFRVIELIRHLRAAAGGSQWRHAK